MPLSGCDCGPLRRLLPAQVSAGRLGVITAVTMRIVPNAQVRRTATEMSVDDFLGLLKRAQDGVNQQGTDAPAVKELDFTQFLWRVSASSRSI